MFQKHIFYSTNIGTEVLGNVRTLKYNAVALTIRAEITIPHTHTHLHYSYRLLSLSLFPHLWNVGKEIAVRVEGIAVQE